MLYARARLRYLAALGLPSLLAPMIACSAGGNGTTSASPSATPTSEPTVAVAPETSATAATTAPVATATETSTAVAETPTATPTATAPTHKGAHTGSWVVELDPPVVPPGPPRHFPSCPHGLFCTAPTALGTAAPAAAPFAACAAEVDIPADLPALKNASHTSFDAKTTVKERKTDPGACCYSWSRLCAGGRPLRGEGENIVADSMARGDWAALLRDLTTECIPNAERAAVAEHYLREAAFEHASIAAFSRASLALLGAGAPPHLLADTHAAAVDEIEHARIAYALASAFGEKAQGPAPLDLRGQKALPGSLAELGTETFVDACIGESVAALMLREAASHAAPVIADLLSRIADDEERHAALAWRTVAWALEQGGAPVRAALNEALEAALNEASVDELSISSVQEESAALALRRHGLLPAEDLREVRLRALREVVAPCARALLAPVALKGRRDQAPSWDLA